MAGAFPDHFSAVAGAYQAHRPGYPAALFDWLASLPARREVAVDCGCGSGQATLALAERFLEVHGVDPGEGQIRSAVPHPRVRYRVAPAEDTGLAPGSADLVAVAQALHWFDLARFYPEVRRLARDGAVLAAFTYGLATVDPAVDAVVGELYHQRVGADWPPARVHVESGYRTLPFPFEEVAAPAFVNEEAWSLSRLLGYLGTWSAVSAFRKRTGQDPVAEVAPALAAAWGPPDALRTVRWPLAVRAGRIG
jgi:SAM-dependent methyltransferase